MRYCDFCGKEVPEEAEYCRNCGKRIGPRTSQPEMVALSSEPTMARAKPKSRAVLWAVILLAIIIVGAIVGVVWLRNPNIIVTARFPGNVMPGATFQVTIIVINAGQVAAENVQVFMRANPAGFFNILQCDHELGALAPNGVVWPIGRLGPGAQVPITCQIRSPTQNGGYEFNFTFNYEGIGERFAATAIVQVGNIVVEESSTTT